MTDLVSTHYDKKYFDWQSSIGEFGGWANQTKFAEYISSNSRVLDFGCGGGYLLKNLECRAKAGVESAAHNSHTGHHGGPSRPRQS